MSEEVLKKPVHAILLKPNTLQQLVNENRLPESLREEAPPLPKEVPQQKAKLKLTAPPIYKDANQAAIKKVRLNVLHSSIPKLDSNPPCDTCVTSACCRAFLVEINQLEYESGVYAEHAIKITPEVSNQLRNPILFMTMMDVPVVTENTKYYLEGMLGEPCPFLSDNGKCKIYSSRPITCRTYSCVDDARITEGMRLGTEPIEGNRERMLRRNREGND